MSRTPYYCHTRGFCNAPGDHNNVVVRVQVLPFYSCVSRPTGRGERVGFGFDDKFSCRQFYNVLNTCSRVGLDLHGKGSLDFRVAAPPPADETPRTRLTAWFAIHHRPRKISVGCVNFLPFLHKTRSSQPTQTFTRSGVNGSAPLRKAESPVALTERATAEALICHFNSVSFPLSIAHIRH